MCRTCRTSRTSTTPSGAMPASRPTKAISAAASMPPTTRRAANISALPIAEIDRRLKNGPDLVSANFVIPYPPGFPIMVPGQVITQETIDFMRKLDVKEIHGYDAAEGLKLCVRRRWRNAAIASRARMASRPPRNKGAGIGEGDIMIDWFVQTLRSYPEIAIFLSLALGYYFGSFTYKGLGLGAVTATLIAAVIIGQLGITISRSAQADLLPDVPVRHRLRRRTAIRARHRAGRNSAGAVCRRWSACSVSAPPISAPSWRAMTSARRPGSMPDRRRSRRRWAWRPTRSTASGCRPKKPRSYWMRCRSPTPSPTFSARSAPRSFWR